MTRPAASPRNQNRTLPVPCVDCRTVVDRDLRLRLSSVNQVFVGWQMRQNSQVGIHDSRFTHSLLVHVNTCGRVVRDGIQHHRDFWWTFEDTPHALFYASRPASEDTNRARQTVTLPVIRWPWQVSEWECPCRRTVSRRVCALVRDVLHGTFGTPGSLPQTKRPVKVTGQLQIPDKRSGFPSELSEI